MLLNHTTTIPLARTLAEIAAAVPVPVTYEREHSRVCGRCLRDLPHWKPTRARG